jgi:hypothetical protein
VSHGGLEACAEPTKEVTSKTERVSFLGVDYVRSKTEDGGDLYLTGYGLRFREHLAPRNWYEPNWFEHKRIRLQGTSAIYTVPTKIVRGRSLQLVVRFSRVGQEVPLAPVTLHQNPDAEFNSPFEEFSILMQLRAAHSVALHGRILTKKPLAIYMPGTRFAEWQTGRLESKMAAKRAQHPEVQLDMRRQYILLYGWIKGLNAVQAAKVLGLDETCRVNFLTKTTLRVITELQQRGLRVLDMKPEHVVVRILRNGSLLRLRNGDVAYALVDYELLDPL